MKNIHITTLTFITTLTISAAAQAVQIINCQIGNARSKQSIELKLGDKVNSENTSYSQQEVDLNLVVKKLTIAEKSVDVQKLLKFVGRGGVQNLGTIAARNDEESQSIKAMLDEYLTAFGFDNQIISPVVDVNLITDMGVYSGSISDENYSGMGLGWIMHNVPRAVANTKEGEPSSLIFFALTNGNGEFYRTQAITNCTIKN